MIIANLEDSRQYEQLHPLLPQLFRYIKQTRWEQVPTGRVELCGSSLYINVDEGQLKPAEEQMLEVHRKYIDVQIPLTEGESMGWTPLCGLKTESVAPFDEVNDRAFYREQPQCFFEVHPGQFAVFFPHDAHAPVIGKGHFRKLVAKVLID